MQSVLDAMEELIGKVKGLFSVSNEKTKLSEFQQKKLIHEFHMFYGE